MGGRRGGRSSRVANSRRVSRAAKRASLAVRSLALFAVMFLVAGCGGGDSAADDQAALDREMDLALEEDAEPELRDEGEAADAGETVAEPETPPARPAPPPAAPVPPPAPAPAPPAATPDPATEPAVEEPSPGPRMVSLTARPGAEFEIELRQPLSTRTNRPGDRFTASVFSPLVDGSRVIVPTAAIVRGEVTAVQKSGGQGQQAIIKIAFLDVSFNGETWPLSATVVEATPETEGRYSTGDKAARIGAGAVAGAILGRVIGGNARGTVIGAAVGAAAGTAITLATEDVDAVLAEGSVLRLRLDEPLTVEVPDPLGG